MSENSSPAKNEGLELRLEIEQVSLLFQQNIQGLVALVACGISYLILGAQSRPRNFLISWATILGLSAVIRLLLTFRWRRRKKSINSLEEVRSWLRTTQNLLLVSGFSWGVVAWLIPSAQGITEQLVSCMVVVLMAAGGVVAYSSSLRASLSVFLPAMVPGMISLWITGNPNFRWLAAMMFLYILLGIRAAKNLNRFVLRFLRLNVENAQLARDLQTEVDVKERAREEALAVQERLHLALEASEAVTWKWIVESGDVTWEGHLCALIGLDQGGCTIKIGAFLEMIHPEDRARVDMIMREAAAQQKDLEMEYRVPRAEGGHRFLAQRGRARWQGDGGLSFDGIAWDVTTIKEQEELKRELTEHEAASRAKSVFLANASHEIRTPLAAINGFADMALHDPTLPEEARRDVQMILRNGKYLISLVNDMLDLSKIESGQIYIEKTRLSVAREIHDLLQLVKPTLESKGLTLRVSYRTRIPETIESDLTRFREVLINLLTNAAKFTDRGSIGVDVSFDIDADGTGLLRIVVADTGIGVPAEDQQKLFRPFMRGLGERVQSVRGSGLGLALSRNLAKLLGGDLRLLGSKEGLGSEFEFTLATGAVEGVRFLDPAEAASSKFDLPVPEVDRPLAGRSVLVVDDSKELQVLMKRYLERRGARVETRANGKEAVERLKEKPYDVVLMDIKMPVMDGYTAAETMRKERYSGPLVAVTAHASAEDRQRCYQAGFDSYLAKPVDFKNLAADLVTLLDRSATRTMLH
ncbi:MAG: response regulator [Bdellovibrionota bacterium]